MLRKKVWEGLHQSSDNDYLGMVDTMDDFSLFCLSVFNNTYAKNTLLA